jgi:hypothetical protein
MLLCKTFEPAFADEKRPDPTQFRGIYFAENETQPRLVWLRIIRVTGDYYVYLSGFKDATSFRSVKGIKDSAVLKRPLDKAIMACFRV